jgi:hypothetical protein
MVRSACTCEGSEFGRVRVCVLCRKLEVIYGTVIVIDSVEEAVDPKFVI